MHYSKTNILNTRFTLFIIVLLGFCPSFLFSQKTDTIVHINGDILTGDFKSLVYGVISYSMEGMNTVSIDEVDISSIKSKKQFEIKMINDSIFYGSFDTSNLKRMVYIILDSSNRKLVSMDDIVEVYRIKRDFWQRTSGNFSLGMNLTKSNSQISLASSGNISHRKRRTFFDLSWMNNLTWNNDTLNSSANQVVLAWQRTIKKKWSSGVSLGYNQNSELGLQARYGLGATIIRDLVYNSWNRLSVSSGLSGSQEYDYGVTDANQYIAGIITVGWKVYRYKEPKVGVSSYIAYLPYINAKRNRVNISLAPEISVFGDNLKVGFSFNYNFDSAPPSDNFSNSDYSLNFQLTYSFH